MLAIHYFAINVIVKIQEKGSTYHSRALKSRSKLKAAIGLRAALENFLLHQNSSLFTLVKKY